MNGNRDAKIMKKINTMVLKDYLVQLLSNYRVDSEQANTLCDILLTAERAGVTTHGLSTFSGHLKRIQDHAYNLIPVFDEIRSGLAFAVIDADNAIGPVSAHYCMKKAIERCHQSGIYMVFCQHANTFGPAFVYPRLAAAAGLIGITMSNSPAAMPFSGGAEPLLGTNPFAIAIPCADLPPIEFDMASSIVAKSKLNEARLKNEQIPSNWAINQDGQPTTDPIEAIKGMILPMAGHKGVGLAMTIDILSGVLSGAAYLNHVGKFYNNPQAMNVGQTFIAIDPSAVFGPDFEAEMTKYQSIIRQSKVFDGMSIHVPGDGKHLSEKQNSGNSLLLDQNTYTNLVQLLIANQIIFEESMVLI